MNDMQVRIKLVKTWYMNKLERVIMIEQDLWTRWQDRTSNRSLCTSTQDFTWCQERKISLIALNAGWPYHASKQARMYEHDQVTLIRHVDTNVHQEKIHQECTPGHVYVVIVSIIQHDTHDSQRRCNASNHYTPWLTVYLWLSVIGARLEPLDTRRALSAISCKILNVDTHSH